MRSISGDSFWRRSVVGREQVRLMLIGGHQVEQHDADAERLGARDPLPDLLEAGEQKAGVARFVKIGFVPPAAEIGAQLCRRRKWQSARGRPSYEGRIIRRGDQSPEAMHEKACLVLGAMEQRMAEFGFGWADV